MIDEKEACDSIDAFCAEYGIDAATKQRMRDDLLATAPKTDIVEFANAPRAIRARRTQLPNGTPRQVGRGQRG